MTKIAKLRNFFVQEGGAFIDGLSKESCYAQYSYVTDNSSIPMDTKLVAILCVNGATFLF